MHQRKDSVKWFKGINLIGTVRCFSGVNALSLAERNRCRIFRQAFGTKIFVYHLLIEFTVTPTVRRASRF